MSHQIASLVDLCAPPIISRLSEKTKEIESKGVKLHYFMRGEPDFDTPSNICEAAVKALMESQTHYPPTRGILKLREAISDRMVRDFGAKFDPNDEVLITSGATMGIYIALRAVVDPGDEVIIVEPTYDPYPTVVSVVGGIPRLVPAQWQAGRQVIPREEFKRVVTKNTKAVLINNPWNPTGMVISKDDLEFLVEFAYSHGLVLISDEIYEKITFNGHRHYNLASISPDAHRITITINSFSKTYAMTGWRIGYNLAPKPLTEAMYRIAQQFSRSAANFIQHAAVEALNGPQNCVEDMINTYTRRRTLVTKSLSKIPGIQPHPPEGTFFYFLDIRSINPDSMAFSENLLQHSGIVTVPGVIYGPSGEGFIRLSFAYHEDVLVNGLEALSLALM